MKDMTLYWLLDRGWSVDQIILLVKAGAFMGGVLVTLVVQRFWRRFHQRG